MLVFVHSQSFPNNLNDRLTQEMKLPRVPEVFSRVRRGASFRRPQAEDTRSFFKT